VLLFAEQDDRALKTTRPQGFRGAAAGLASPCNHDVIDPGRQWRLHSLMRSVPDAIAALADRVSETAKPVCHYCCIDNKNSPTCL